MFIQTKTQDVKNPFRNNAFLVGLTRRFLPNDIYFLLSPTYESFAEELPERVNSWVESAQMDLPRLITHDVFGKQSEKLYSPWGWIKIREFCTANMILAQSYEKKFRPNHRIVGSIFQILFASYSAGYTKIIGKTDGAINLIAKYGDAYLQENILPKLMGRHKEAKSCGQWITETRSCADLNYIETQAVPVKKQGDCAEYRLFGYKWFATGVDSNYALVLAQVKSFGPSMFLMPVWQDGKLCAGISIKRLKNKFGTKVLPTAEVALEGASARIVGQPGQGVSLNKSLGHIDYFYTVLESSSLLNRVFFEVRSYAQVRQSGAKFLGQFSLYQQILSDLDTRRCGAIALCFEIARILGRVQENNYKSEEKKILRALLPISQIILSRWALWCTSEAMEAMGGVGYIEESGFPNFMRDAQALRMQNGGTNLILREILVAQAEDNSLVELLKNLCERANGIMIDEGEGVRILRQRLHYISEYILGEIRKSDGDYPIYLEASMRKYSYLIGLCTMAVLLAESKPFITDDDLYAPNRFTVFVENNLCGQIFC